MIKFPQATAGALALILGLLLAAGSQMAVAAERGPERISGLASQLAPIRGGDDRAIAIARGADLTISKAERVLVQVYVSGPVEQAAERLRMAGMSVKATAEEPLPVVEGWVQATRLGKFAGFGLTDAVMPVVAGGSDAGSIQSEGVAAHRIPQAFASGASGGDGVDVGVISTSINQLGAGVAGSQASGDLPASVNVLKEGTATDDEGRAMAEIIFDGAPGIDSILFASGTNSGPADKADSIDQLVAAGAEVIADDIFWLNEPFFQDGVTAQAVDRARDAGVTYIASAGNRARQSWEGTYQDAAGVHDFDPGAGVDTLQPVATVPDDGIIQLVVQWDETWGGAESDLDFKLVDFDGNPLPCFVAPNLPGANPIGGLDNNLETGFPAEIVAWQNNCEAGNVEVALKIERFSGTNSPFIKYIALGDLGNFDPEDQINANTINPDAAAADGALTVAAVKALDPGLDTPEPFSSRGPITRLFDAAGQRLPSPEVRIKPELAAADGLSTTVPDFSPFFGTSAAVPSAASIAAILRSTNPAASADEIEQTMTDPANAIACVEPPTIPIQDPFESCGAGFLLADRAVSSFDRDGPLVTPKFSPARPNGKRGWFTRSVGFEWQVSDPQSLLISQNCPSATVSEDGIRTFTCSAVSGGGSTEAAVQIKLDRTKPKKPKVKGIKPRTYRLSGRPKLPKKKRIKCRSSDRTSGLASCRIKGYSRKKGRHTLVARATDKAGLSSVRKLRYRVR